VDTESGGAASLHGAAGFLEVRVINGNLAHKAVMAVSVGDIALVFDVPTLTTELAFTQEVAESRIMVLAPAPFAERFTSCGFLPPRILEDIHPFESNSMGETCTTTKTATYVGIDHVGDTKGGVCVHEEFVGDPGLLLVC
jgi:hypothetical protein